MGIFENTGAAVAQRTVSHTCSISKTLYFLLIEAELRIYPSVIQAPLVKIIACRLIGAKPLFEPNIIR